MCVHVTNPAIILSFVSLESGVYKMMSSFLGIVVLVVITMTLLLPSTHVQVPWKDISPKHDLSNCLLCDHALLFIMILSVCPRSQRINLGHVKAQRGASHSTRLDSKLDLLYLLLWMWTFRHVLLRGAATLLISPMFQVPGSPQAMTVCL